MRQGAGDCAPGGRDDAVAVREEDGPEHDPGRIQDRRQGVEGEPPVGHQDLAERERGREQDLGQAVDLEQLHVQLPGGSIEACDPIGEPRRGQEDDHARDRHDPDRSGEDRTPEVVGGPLIVPPQAGEDRDERRGQAGRDEDVESDLGDAEGRVVGIEFEAGAIRVREDPVADQSHRKVAEAEQREDDRAAREDMVEQGAQRGGGSDGRTRHADWTYGEA